jgi:hypothetical protein
MTTILTNTTISSLIRECSGVLYSYPCCKDKMGRCLTINRQLFLVIESNLDVTTQMEIRRSHGMDLDLDLYLDKGPQKPMG